MAAVTPNKTGKYFYENGRVWREAIRSGVPPKFIGKWNGPTPLPDRPTPDWVREMSWGTPLKQTTKDRVAGLDCTFTWSKSASLWAYGLTQPDKRAEKTQVFSGIIEKVMEPRLDAVQIGLGAGGKDKRAANAVGVPFHHTDSYLGLPHGHSHVFVPNVATTPDGHTGSIRNARDVFFRAQGEMRAEANKRLDDHFQSKGYATFLDGKAVGLTGIPKAMVEELSPAAAAIEEAKARRGQAGPRAADFAAWTARRMVGPAVHRTPEEMHQHCLALAKRYGVTPESLKKTPTSGPTEKGDCVAYEVAIEARDGCAKKYGLFTASQFREELYLRGIGRATTTDELKAMGDMFLKDRRIAGVMRESGQANDPNALFTSIAGRKTSQAAEQPYAKEATADLGKAVKELGKAVLVATARKAAEVIREVSEAINPRPRILRVKSDNLESLLKEFRPKHRVVAHAKALLAGVLASGNPHERAAAAERVYSDARSHKRFRKNTVIVVTDARRASARELKLLAKVARRDGCSVLLAERMKPAGRTKGSPPHGMPHDKARGTPGRKGEPKPWKHQPRGPGYEYER